MFGEPETDKDKLVDFIHARSPKEPIPKFPEVTGICRTCSNAHIMRRQYGEVPCVICTAYGMRTMRMPLDVVECTSYERRGGISLREMAEMAIILDNREQGGQYL